MNHYVILLLLLLVSPAVSPLRADDAETFPFRSVVAARDTLVATLPQGRRWLVQVGSSEPRLSEPGESFTIHAGPSLRLIERHASYLVTAQATAPAGLQVEHTSDARSVGGEVTKKSFFIPAH